MAAGDPIKTCTHNLSAEQLFASVIVEGNDGEPAVRIYNPDGSGGGGSTPTPTVRTPSLSIFTNASSIAAGAKSVSITNTGAINVTVLGTILKPLQSVSFNAGDYDTLGAISYVATGGEITVSKIV